MIKPHFQFHLRPERNTFGSREERMVRDLTEGKEEDGGRWKCGGQRKRAMWGNNENIFDALRVEVENISNLNFDLGLGED